MDAALRTILALWDDGLCSRGELVDRLVEHAVATDIDAVLRALPAELRVALRARLDDYGPEHGPAENYLTLWGGTEGPGFDLAELKRAATDKLRAVTLPVVRAWLARDRR